MSKAEVVSQGSPDVALCSFTFDDGPANEPVEDWLDALEANGARGTFFFTGEWIDAHPRQAREMVRRGHELASHTYHHRRLAQVEKALFFEELKQAELALQEVLDQPVPAFIRFPYFSYTEVQLEWLHEWGCFDVEGVSSDDWSGISADRIVDVVAPHLQNGLIVIHHCNDIATGTPQALRRLIPLAQRAGLTPVTLSELLARSGKPPLTRSWRIVIDVPAKADFTTAEWSELEASELAQVTDDVRSWGPYYREFAPSSGPDATDGERVAVRRFFEQSWAYFRAEPKGDVLVLNDFITREAQADALVYVLRYAIRIAQQLGCSHISASRDMRRLHKMCEQLGWTSVIELDCVQT